MYKTEQIQFVSTTPNDLADLISQKVNEALDLKLKGLGTAPEKKEYVTREEASKLLNVTYATLWRYAKDGKLTPYKFSKKVYYKLADIEQGFIKSE